MDTATIRQTNQIRGQEGNIYVDDSGSGRLPVVFTHSFGGDSSHWKNQLEHLRSHRRAIAFDSRGHGKSSASDKHSIQPKPLQAILPLLLMVGR